MIGNIFQAQKFKLQIEIANQFFLRGPLIQANMVSAPYACLIQINGMYDISQS